MIPPRILLTCLVASIGSSSIAQEPPDVDETAEARLDAPATLHFPEETALRVVLDAIKKEAGKDLAIEVDREALKKAGLSTDAKVKLDIDGIPLKAALTQVVRQAGLIYTVTDSKATVTVDTYKEPDPKALEAQMKAVDTTVFAPGFDEAKFRSIEPGMAEAQVVKRVGKPLRETRSRPQVDWYYGPPTLRVTEDGGMFDTSGFFGTAWGYTIARANPEGKIFEVLGGYFPDVPKEMVGGDLEEMKKKFGDPIAIRTVKSTRYLVYSGSKSSGSFRTRAVGLDQAGKVTDVIAGYYFD